MKKLMVYIHGKGGNAGEAEHYKTLFPDFDVVGFDYSSCTPWDAKAEFPQFFGEVSAGYEDVQVIANSIGAFFAMSSGIAPRISKAYFISPIVDMEKLIANMMMWAGVNENDLRERGDIETSFDETLSWKYLTYVRENPIRWNVPTHVLYGSGDNLTDLATMQNFVGADFAQSDMSRTNDALRTLTVMEGGEHWFHTDEQMNFLDRWIKNV